jgi:hypothetical protein
VGLLSRDHGAGRAAARALGIGGADDYDALSTLLTFRPSVTLTPTLGDPDPNPNPSPSPSPDPDPDPDPNPNPNSNPQQASRAALGSRMSAEERRALRARFEGLGAQDVNLFLERLPRDMLFVMRTWALVRSLNRKLGGTTRQRFLTMGEHAATGAARHALSRRHGGWGVLLAALHERLALLKMRLLMRSYDLVLRLLLRWHGTRPYSSLEPG